MSYVSRRNPVLGKMEDPHLPHRFVGQWWCGEGQGHPANRITTQILEVRRRADGLKIF